VAAILKQALGVDATLTPGKRGELSVWLDGRRILDKDLTCGGEFPDETMVLAAIRGLA
jgi:hypothetical protein